MIEAFLAQRFLSGRYFRHLDVSSGNILSENLVSDRYGYSDAVIGYEAKQSAPSDTGYVTCSSADPSGGKLGKQYKLGWFSALHCGGASLISSAKLTEAFLGIQKLLEAKENGIVNAALSGAIPSEMPLEAIVGLLRYTFGAKNNLSAWEVFRGRALAELQSRQIDADRVLIGLL